MKPQEALKNRIRQESEHIQNEEKPDLLDILRKRNRDLEVRESRRALLRRIRLR